MAVGRLKNDGDDWMRKFISGSVGHSPSVATYMAANSVNG